MAGGALALWCILAFALVGKGTPAPFDPPRRLVVAGPYRYVRNPMYIGAGLALTGAAMFYGSLRLLSYVGHAATQGQEPRDFNIDPTGTFLLVANQSSDTIVTFRLDATTGGLSAIGQVSAIKTRVQSRACKKPPV